MMPKNIVGFPLALFCFAVLACTPTTEPLMFTGDGGSAPESATGGDWTVRNECEDGSHDCSPNASCTDTASYYECSCHEGYDGDGYSCTDIDECATGIHDCDDHASCTNTGGAHTCTCNDGFVGDGLSCQSNYLSITSGEQHNCARRDDNTLWCWGHAGNGRLGQPGASHSSIPIQVDGTDWADVVAGALFTCGLKSDGSLWCWGYNNYGAIGNGKLTGSQTTPAQVGDTDPWSDWEMVAGGYHHSCGLRTGGALYCWGRGNWGQLGDGTNTNKNPLPIAIATGQSFEHIAAGYYHTCAIDDADSLWCWGRNNAGQLGFDSSGNNVTTPTKIGDSNDNWKTLALGHFHSCGLKADDSLWCWGHNDYGQLGDDNSNDSNTPVAIDAPNKYSAIWSTYYHSCGLRMDGELRCWGDGRNGQVDPAKAGVQTVPALANSDEDWQMVGVGRYHSCGLRNDGTVQCWGLGTYGQTGLGTFSKNLSPIQVSSQSPWSAIGTGSTSSCGILTDKSLWCWGDNDYGQLGVGNESSQKEPQAVPGTANWQHADTGAKHGCGLRADGALTTAWCWGDNASGRLGNDSSVYEQAPIVVPDIDNWQQLSVGQDHNCGIRADSTLWCWGENGNGQIGNGNTSDVKQPQAVGAAAWQQVSAGTTQSCGIQEQNGKLTLWCWGKNQYNQLGLGTSSNKELSPQQVGVGEDWSAVSVGSQHACGLQTPGTLWCWGRNNQGQLGLGHKNEQSVPLQVWMGMYNDWTAVSAGISSTCAIRQGMLYCWGSGSYGRLGLGSEQNQTSPKQVGNGNDWLMVATGTDHTCGLRQGDALYCWGSDRFGALGLGTAWPDAPATILNP